MEEILGRLAELGFATRMGGFAPFNETLPLVEGVAWDTTTAQIALVAEMGAHDDLADWRQLLFTAAGLRHNLRQDGGAGFGSPVVLALVDDVGSRRLRDLSEDLAANYAVFNRVDLNLVRLEDIENAERLDDALAPLLPRCRMMLGQEISREDIKRFWGILRTEVATAAEALDATFGSLRTRAGEELAERLIAQDEDSPELPAPHPLQNLSIQNFRSIREAEVVLAPVTIVHGPNGGGKSTLLEAMELVWAGTSQRKPPSVSPDEYGRHLPRNGIGAFRIASGDQSVEKIVADPRAELRRNVLAHESVTALVALSPEDRYAALLATTGLEMPDLAARAQMLLDEAKRAADSALTSAGLPTLPRRDSVALKHLRESLRSEFGQRLPSTYELVGAEETLVSASAGAYKPRVWPREEHVAAALLRADGEIAGALDGSTTSTQIAERLDAAATQVLALIGPRREAVDPFRRLLEVLRRPSPERPLSAVADLPPTPVPQDVAIRWLTHINGSRDAMAKLRMDAGAISDRTWADRLRSYTDAVDDAAMSAPASELKEFSTRAPGRSRVAASPEVPEDVYSRAGFATPPADPVALVGAVQQLLELLEKQVEALDRLARDLGSHPARDFHAHADDVLGRLCAFELARRTRTAGPILNASERLIGELLHTRLAPLVRELVASIVRFEWYFQPLLMPEKGRRIIFGGLATSQADLDARLLLNSAEGTALGIAWFMAIHLLQPRARQEVLVLDDPTSVFDAANQAGLISTLRAYARLTRPQQLVVATHDESIAGALANEFAPVDSWPSGLVRLRCQRDSSDRGVVISEPGPASALSLADEIELLGLSKSGAAPIT